jgi:hypothetical protein
VRGKKSDPVFVSQFISDCVKQGLTTPKEIVQAAKNEIEDIDNQIKEVEKLKVIRSKLLDVLNNFDQPKAKVVEDILLPLFNLQHPGLCKYLCDMVKEGDISMKTVDDGDADVKFCFKQLLEHKILARIDDRIIRGDRFGEYMRFILCEVK